MLDIVLILFVVVFAAGVGFFIGAGNYRGLKGAIVPGLFAGLLASVPAIREQQWYLIALTCVCALAGSIVCAFTTDRNWLKLAFRQQRFLYVRIGSYCLGQK